MKRKRTESCSAERPAPKVAYADCPRQRRVEEAIDYVPLEKLALSPQCGFASVDIGNKIDFDAQIAKLELVVRTAEEIWGE